MKKAYLFIVIILSFAVGVYAADRSKEDMKTAALRVLASNARRSASHNVQADELKEYVTKEKLSVFGYRDGFVVIAKDDRFREVLGYSQTAYQDTMPCGFKWWLDQIDATMKLTNGSVESYMPRQLNAALKTSVQPMITTKWGQQKPFNDNCVYKLNGKSYRFVTGCIATAMAQIMNYYKYPEKGHGTNSYVRRFNEGNIAISADFSQSTYDWENMLDDYSSYSNSSLKDSHTQAVAKLMSDCGVSVNMQYNGNASSASQADVPAALRYYFSYDEFATHYFRDNRTASQWMEMIYDELSNNRPILYGGSSSQGGHAFILHGYNEEGLVYVNWGWNGNSDGYFDIDLLNPDDYSFKSDQEMVIFSPNLRENIKSVVVTLNNGERLDSKIQDEDKYLIDELKVIGEINSEDVLFIRNMVGYGKEYDTHMDGKLTKLDLSEAIITASAEAYFSGNNIDYKTENNVFPSYFFAETYSCGRISSIVLPQSITKIGRNAFFPCANLINIVIPSKVTKIDMQAFQYCRNLKTITLENPTPAAITSTTFGDVNKSECILYVPAGTKSLYKGADYWNEFKNILEVGEKQEDQVYKVTVNIGDGGTVYYNGNQLINGNSDIEVKYNGEFTLNYDEKPWYSYQSVSYNSNSISINNGSNQITIKGVREDFSVTINFKSSDIASPDNDMEKLVKYKRYDEGVKLYSVNSKVDGRFSLPPNIIIDGTTYSTIGIEASAFNNCKLITEVIIPSTVTSIGDNAFAGCNELKYVLLLSSSIPQVKKITNAPFYFVPKEMLDTYISTDVWKDLFVVGLTEQEITDFIGLGIIPYFKQDLNNLLEGSVSISATSNFRSTIKSQLVNNSDEDIIIKKIILRDKIIGKVIDEKKDLYAGLLGRDEVVVTIKSGNSYTWSTDSYTSEIAPLTEWHYYYRNKEVVKVIECQYKLTYKIDGIDYKTYELVYGESISPEPVPNKETYIFSGWSEIPETMPNHDVVVTGSYERHFDVGHVTNIVNFIMNGNATNDDVELYDMNNDGELNIGDIILIVKNILKNGSSAPNAICRRTYEVIDLSKYTAAQFIVKVADNISVKDIHLVNSMGQSHQLMYQQIDTNKYAVVVFSLTNHLMIPEGCNIIEVETYNNNDVLTIEDVTVAKPSGETESYHTMPISTSIQQIEKKDSQITIYNLKGNRLSENKKLKKGIYIINGKKAVVK